MANGLWAVQILLALVFVAAGMMKVTQPREKLIQRMAWVENTSDSTVKLIGTVEILGALGLVLPAALGIAPWLTPLAAAGLAVVMVLATVTHLRRGELTNVVVNLVLLALAAFVAVERFGTYPLPMFG